MTYAGIKPVFSMSSFRVSYVKLDTPTERTLLFGNLFIAFHVSLTGRDVSMLTSFSEARGNKSEWGFFPGPKSLGQWIR